MKGPFLTKFVRKGPFITSGAGSGQRAGEAVVARDGLEAVLGDQGGQLAAAERAGGGGVVALVEADARPTSWWLISGERAFSVLNLSGTSSASPISSRRLG